MDIIALGLAIVAAIVFLAIALEGKRFLSLATGLLLLDLALICQFVQVATHTVTAH